MDRIGKVEVGEVEGLSVELLACQHGRGNLLISHGGRELYVSGPL